MTDEEARHKLSHYRDTQFATLLVSTIQLAAMSHSEELRKALATVFDLSVIEDYHRRIMTVVTSAQQYAEQARALCQQVSEQVEEIERRIDSLEGRLEDYSQRKVTT